MAGFNLFDFCLAIIWVLTMGLVIWAHIWHTNHEKQITNTETAESNVEN